MVAIDMPDISMSDLDDEDIGRLDDITLAEAIREARRRIKARKLWPASARPAASQGSPPPSPTADPDHPRVNAELETLGDIDFDPTSHRCVRRRLNDDDDANIFAGPSFFGKTLVKDINH
jgi:hypothetical protein